ncbi:hypothetical protein FTW19_00385 [Terriglobus albidus]|uniref:Uncharacterized protein n=1 Tax=Terriglobus albidus TaxID=1592106 RepID=A0A5B9EH03_9BACT|nr:hypothetical protein [Terriglobus albidus]QEE31099.1 hypothetical protein FTW19_00385 [Terriglobus albidus]
MLALVAFAIVFWLGRQSRAYILRPDATLPSGTRPAPDGHEPTRLYAHNVMLRKGPHFRVYVRWIRGQMRSTRTGQHPSFDLPESFLLEIEKGVINVKLADIADYLNSGETGKSPLTDISIENKDGESKNGEIQVHGTLHKLMSLPVQLRGVLSPLPDGRLKFHLNKISVLKIPMKGLLGVFHVNAEDLVPSSGVEGVQVSENDLYLDTQRFLPPPHIQGQISSVTPSGEELKVIYGNADTDEQKLAQWHNFLRLVGGSLDFGKLSMRQADLTMIDATDDPWFELDLANYQAQLVYGTTRMTEKAGVEVYMPDLKNLPPEKRSTKGVTVEWLRNRNTSPPLDVEKVAETKNP